MSANSETFNFIENEISTAQLVHPGDSTTETRVSDKLKGDGYYGRSDGLHTVQYNLNGFIGNIVVQGTLAVSPEDSDWFTASDSEYSTSTTSTGAYLYNFTGNYVWVRIYISSWTDGTITSIVLNH